VGGDGGGLGARLRATERLASLIKRFGVSLNRLFLIQRSLDKSWFSTVSAAKQ